MKIIRKTFEIKQAELQENRGRGIPSVMGVMDRGRDVIYPGAFSAKCLKQFLKDGFVPVGHEWDGLPVAYPISAVMQGANLVCEWEFHSTEKAQEARTVCVERLDKGLSVGLSVGFMPDYDSGVHWFETGKDLLKHAEEAGCDMSLFDAKTIRACKSFCRGISTIAELYEFSIVPVPMNPHAVATEAKGEDGEEEDGISHITMATERKLEKFLRDAAGLSQKSAKEAIAQRFKTLLRDVDGASEPQPEPTPEPADDSALVKAAALRQRHLALRHDLMSAGVTL